MEGYGISTYGDRIASAYDRLYGDLFDVDAEADFLAGLAGGGRALELAIGTGRVALPLTQRGVEVHGIDASAEMVERLRAKPGGRDIPVTMGDIADVEVEGEFDLVYVVFNTFFALTTQEAQVRCFRNVAAHLADGGRFVLSAFVPDMTRFERQQSAQVHDVKVDGVMIAFSQHDAKDQTVATQQVLIEGGRFETFPVFLRYVWPSEMDLMAELAGLALESRHADFRGSRFLSSSTHHVSTYRKG